MYIGSIVSANGALINPANIAAITEWHNPRNLKELQLFLSTVAYYHQYLRDFAKDARPLNKLMMKGVQRE